MTSAIRLYCRFAAEGADEVDDEDDELNEGHEGHTDVEPHQTTDTAEQRFDLERDHEKNESDNISTSVQFRKRCLLYSNN